MRLVPLDVAEYFAELWVVEALELGEVTAAFFRMQTEPYGARGGFLVREGPVEA